MTDREFIQLLSEAPAWSPEAWDRMRRIEQNDRTGMIRRAFLFARNDAEALHTAYAVTPPDRVTR